MKINPTAIKIRIIMSNWKHDRNFYIRRAEIIGKFAIYCFALAIVFIAIFIIEPSSNPFWIPGISFFVFGLLLNRMRNKYRYYLTIAASII